MSVFTLLCYILLVAYAQESTKNKVLVVFEENTITNTHSHFFQDLTARGFALTFHHIDDSDLLLVDSEVFLYDHLILFAKEFGRLKVQTILDFIDSGHNVFMASDSFGSDSRELGSECGVEFPEGHFVFDHFQVFDIEPGEVAISVSPEQLLSAPVVIPSVLKDSILYKGTSQIILHPYGLNFAILNANPTSYSGKSTQVTDARESGNNIILISAMQARNQARLVFSGSSSMFSNKYYQLSTSNRYVSNEITKWVFQERGIVRASHIEIKGQTSNRLTVKDTLSYSVQIDEWNSSHWIPFVSSKVQFEFVMLQPFIRKNLQSTQSGLYQTSFQIPDISGVFTCKLRFQELGYNTLDIKNSTPVRPFSNDEHSKFSPSSHPYYSLSCLVILALTIVASTLYLIR